MCEVCDVSTHLVAADVRCVPEERDENVRGDDGDDHPADADQAVDDAEVVDLGRCACQH